MAPASDYSTTAQLKCSGCAATVKDQFGGRACTRSVVKSDRNNLPLRGCKIVRTNFVAVALVISVTAYLSESANAQTPKYSSNAIKLIEYAEAQLSPISDAERALLVAVADSKAAYFNPSGKHVYLRRVPIKHPSRILRAKLIEWLLRSNKAKKMMSFLSIHGAWIEGRIDLSYLNVNHNIYLYGCKITKGIGAIGAEIRSINFEASTIDGYVLFDRADIKGNLSFHRADISGAKVRLYGINIEGDLVLEQTKANNISVSSATVNGSVFAKGLEVRGELDFKFATIKTTLFWEKIKAPRKVTLDLRYANIGTLVDDYKSWPVSGKLRITGFEYSSIHCQGRPCANRVEWIRRQCRKCYHPQPYEQLARVYKQLGAEELARYVLIAKNNDLRKILPVTSGEWWRLTFTWIIDYGYYPWKIIFYVIIPFVLFGVIVFGLANRAGLMAIVETKLRDNKGQSIRPHKNNPKYALLMYSIDAFLPLLDLRQASNWIPRANQGRTYRKGKRINFTTGDIIWWYYRLHSLVGWVSFTVIAAALIGLLRN